MIITLKTVYCLECFHTQRLDLFHQEENVPSQLDSLERTGLGNRTPVVVHFLHVISVSRGRHFDMFQSPNYLNKAIPVTGRGGPWGCETSRFPHFLDNQLTDGGEVVSLMRSPTFTPQEDSWDSFLLEVESTPGP
jgi:hypothetical protein